MDITCQSRSVVVAIVLSNGFIQTQFHINHIRLPAECEDSITVQPNMTAVKKGVHSSGLSTGGCHVLITSHQHGTSSTTQKSPQPPMLCKIHNEIATGEEN